MNNLSNTIYTYYREHLAELPDSTRFHFASRLYLWGQDKASKDTLNDLRAWATHDEHPDLALREIIRQAAAEPVHGSKNAAALRRPFFERFPMLKTYVSVLFRITFLSTIYDIDTRPLFHAIFPEPETEAFARTLLADDDAIRTLSTHAVNFLYLYYGVIHNDTRKVDVDRLFAVGQQNYDLTDPLEMQLFVYLYTHCIIGESLFYSRVLPADRRTIYGAMLDSIENRLSSDLTAANLDCKFEFLVCCRLLERQSKLKEAIFAEAEQSMSSDGNFLIDRHNRNPQVSNTTLATSEHRNVLFVLADTPFTPIQPGNR